MSKGAKPRATQADVELGKRLKKFREAKSLSQPDLAELVGLSHQQIQKYETGKNRIPGVRLIQFRKILGVPWDIFLGTDRNDISPIFQALEEKMTSERIGELWTDVSDDHVRDALFTLIFTIQKASKANQL